MKKHARLVAMILAFAPAVANAQEVSLDTALNGFSTLSFGSQSVLAIGDGLDVIDPTIVKDRCTEVKAGDIKPDTTGSVESRMRFSLVKDFDSFENTFNFSYSVEASGSAKMGKILGGDTTLTNFGSFENFLKQESSSALIIMEVYSDYGRELIQDFSLREPYKTLIENKKFAEFRQKCGTHFVRGWSKKSSIKVIFQVSNIDKQAKIIIDNTMKGVTNANFGVGDVVSGTAKTDVSNTLKDTLIIASKLGKVSASVQATGGKGISTVSQIATAGDPTSPDFIGKLLGSLATAAGDFDQANAAPDAFLVVKYPALAPGDVDFNADNFKKLGDIYRALLLVDQRLSAYEGYRTKDPALWEKYFRVTTDEITALRTSLLKAYSSCRNQGDCTATIPKTIDGLILEDIFTSGSLDAVCIHSYKHEDLLNGKPVESFDYLSSIAMVWNSKVNFLNSIDFDSMQASVITPEFTLKNIPFDPTRQMRIRENGEGNNGDILIDVAREVVKPDDLTVDGEFKVDKLRQIRAKVAQSVFIVTAQTNNGLDVEAVLGRPNMTGCPAYVSQ